MKSSAKRECHNENVFLKADRALSKLNFLFYLNPKTNLVTLRKCVTDWFGFIRIDVTELIGLSHIDF